MCQWPTGSQCHWQWPSAATGQLGVPVALSQQWHQRPTVATTGACVGEASLTRSTVRVPCLADGNAPAGKLPRLKNPTGAHRDDNSRRFFLHQYSHQYSHQRRQTELGNFDRNRGPAPRSGLVWQRPLWLLIVCLAYRSQNHPLVNRVRHRRRCIRPARDACTASAAHRDLYGRVA